MKKILLAVLLLSGMVFGQTNIATDSFTYSNGALQTVSGGNWTETGNGNAWTVSSNALTNTSTGGSTTVVYGEKWTGTGTFANDQFAELTLNSSSSTTRFGGVILRASGNTYYFFLCASTQCKAGKWNGSTITNIQAATAHGLTFPLTLHAEVTGTTLIFKVNGSVPAGFSASYTDSTYTTGLPGIATNGSTTVTGDNFVGGNMGNPPAATPTFSGSASAVTISSTTSGATLCYTEDGSTPTANGAGTCTHGSTYSAPFATTGTTIKAIATKSTTSDSAVGTFTIAAAPTISPASGTYILQQTITMSCGSGSPHYTTDGTTPTSGSTTYSGSFSGASSGPQTVKAICSGGSPDSAVTTNAYNIAPSDVSIASDDFSNYYDANLAPNQVQQKPLEIATSAGKWQTVGGLSVDVGVNELPSHALAAVRPALKAAVTSGYAVGTGTSKAKAVYVGKTGFANDQYSAAKIPAQSGGVGGVAVRCSTVADTCYYFYAGAGTSNESLLLGKFVSGTDTTIGSATNQTVTAGSTIELRVVGTTLQPLINGSTPPGMSATYTDSSISSGSPGIIAYNNGYVSDWSGGNIGVSDGTSASTYSPTYPTYTDSAMSTSSWTMKWPWFQAQINAVTTGAPTPPIWNGPFGPTLITGTTYGIGVTTSTSGTIAYRGGEFGSNQWQKYKVGINPWDTGINNWFAVLQHETWIPGTSGGCTTAGTAAFCYDHSSYYPGVQFMRKMQSLSGTTAACGGVGAFVKNEYNCTPFFHITKVTPKPSAACSNPTTYPEGCDEVVTVAGSPVTILKGDEIFEQYLNNHIQVACKSSGAISAWQASHAYSLNDIFTDANGHLQRVTTAGTSGGTIPSTWGTGWTSNIGAGDTTTSGSVVSEYFGTACPSTSVFTWIINAPDSDLTGRSGVPGLWSGQGGGSATPLPVFYDWSAGTATSGTSLAVIGLSAPSSYQPAPVIFW